MYCVEGNGVTGPVRIGVKVQTWLGDVLLDSQNWTAFVPAHQAHAYPVGRQVRFTISPLGAS